MLNIVLFGAPGAGKGTQAVLLAKRNHLIHLSTGDLLRKEIAVGSELGKIAQQHINKGEFVADNVVINIIRSQIERHPNVKGFIFDGFPRTTAQAEVFDRMLGEKDMTVDMMIALDVETDELIDRLMKRGIMSGRPDDQSLDIIRNRIDIYHQKTLPIIDYYNAQKKYHLIDGSGSIESISDRLQLHIQRM